MQFTWGNGCDIIRTPDENLSGSDIESGLSDQNNGFAAEQASFTGVCQKSL